MIFNDPPWHPINNPVDIKHLGKLQEELGELQSAIARCLIQGLDEVEPTSKKVNRTWLMEELVDVVVNIDLVIEHFELPMNEYEQRYFYKRDLLSRWHKSA